VCVCVYVCVCVWARARVCLYLCYSHKHALSRAHTHTHKHTGEILKVIWMWRFITILVIKYMNFEKSMTKNKKRHGYGASSLSWLLHKF